MKTLSLVTLAFVSTAMMACGSASIKDAQIASGYPADYCHQSVRTFSDGPALFAHIGSGCYSGDVIAYKKSGYLASQNPEIIDAIIDVRCSVNGETRTRVSTVQLGREWNGTGYMSSTLQITSFYPQGCYDTTNNIMVGVAFSANGQWDSRNGANYIVPGYGLFGASANDPRLATLSTHEGGYSNINMKSWSFIIEQMRR